MIKETKTLWYAVDSTGFGWLHEYKPTRSTTFGEWVSEGLAYEPENSIIDENLLPPITWDDECVELTITITIEYSQLIEFKK